PPPAEIFPVAGVTAGIIGMIQATEVCKYLLCRGDLLAGRLLLWDGIQGRIEEIPVETDPDCEACAGKYTGIS
ncbi:MAG TPA: adenylyltransferase, partial [Methanoregulaceae archaeon]|nr:adenylyltransferase [Methanoregulaceae archaeon]